MMGIAASKSVRRAELIASETVRRAERFLLAVIPTNYNLSHVVFMPSVKC